MFAIIEDGGRQYYVKPGDRLRIDLRDGVEQGGTVKFESVLLGNGGGSSVVGKPSIDGASVTASVVDPLLKGQKLEIQKIRRSTEYKIWVQGHLGMMFLMSLNTLKLAAWINVEGKVPKL